MTYRDRLPGGLADERKPEDFDPKELRRGVRVEMEHTDDPEIAREIAMDHLAEDEGYYEKLEALERSTFRMQANLRRGSECGECLQENQLGGAGTALIVGAAAALAYFLFLKPAKAAKPATTPATCAIDPQKLDAWARARGFYVLYFPQADTAPPFDDDFEQALVRKYPGIEDIPDIELKQFVAVIRDGSFWYYLITGVGDEGIEKGRADNLRADYCAFSGTQTVSGGYGPYAALS